MLYLGKLRKQRTEPRRRGRPAVTSRRLRPVPTLGPAHAPQPPHHLATLRLPFIPLCSDLHDGSPSSSPPPPPPPPPVSGLGARLLTQLGWTPGTGLGTRRDGIAEPLAVTTRTEGTGLGKAPPSRERLYARTEWWAEGFASALQRTGGANAAEAASSSDDSDDSDGEPGGGGGGGLGLGASSSLANAARSAAGEAQAAPAAGAVGIFAACEGRRCRPAGAAKLARLAAQDARGAFVSYDGKTVAGEVVAVPAGGVVTLVPGAVAPPVRRKEPRSGRSRDKLERSIRKAARAARRAEKEEKRNAKAKRRDRKEQ